MSAGSSNIPSLALLTHLFLHKAIPSAPLWLHQALSAYFTQTSVQAGQGRWLACFGHRIAIESRLFQLPLDKFFAITWRGYPEAGPGFVRGTGRLLMDFILHGDQGAHLQKLPAIFAAVGQGASGPEVMAAAFPGVSLEQLGQRISNFKGSQIEQRSRGVLCPLPIPIEGDRIPDESDPQESPFPTQDVEQLLTRLKKLPHGTALPSWYPLEVVGIAPTTAAHPN